MLVLCAVAAVGLLLNTLTSSAFLCHSLSLFHDKYMLVTFFCMRAFNVKTNCAHALVCQPSLDRGLGKWSLGLVFAIMTTWVTFTFRPVAKSYIWGISPPQVFLSPPPPLSPVGTMLCHGQIEDSQIDHSPLLQNHGRGTNCRLIVKWHNWHLHSVRDWILFFSITRTVPNNACCNDSVMCPRSDCRGCAIEILMLTTLMLISFLSLPSLHSLPFFLNPASGSGEAL